MIRVLLFFGGKSPEHEISVLSAISVLRHVDKKSFHLIPIGITRNGEWASSEQTARMLPKDLRGEVDYSRSKILASFFEKTRSWDLVFPLFHGPYGEDGTIQGFLEFMGIPFVGSGVLASSTSMDKIAMKQILASMGLPQVEYCFFTREEWQKNPFVCLKRIEQKLSYPIFVKPANSGSSIGITKVPSQKEMDKAMSLAFGYDRRVLVEQGILARELEVSVLGNLEDEKRTISSPGEIIPSREFYNYEAKYYSDSKLVIPAQIKPSTEQKIKEYTEQTFFALNCQGLLRVDFFLEEKLEKEKNQDDCGVGNDDDGTIYVNEVNTLPGFTPISMYPKLMEQEGISYTELISRLFYLALKRKSSYFLNPL